VMYANSSAAAGTSAASQLSERMHASMRAAQAAACTPGPAFTHTGRQRGAAVHELRVR
jgi:hypothetical protein